MTILDLATIPFEAAAHFSPGRRLPIQFVVIHTVEAAEGPATDQNVADYYAGSTAPHASMHYSVGFDPTGKYHSIIQEVHDQDTAYAAPPLNDVDLAGETQGAGGIHIEHVGYAKQTASDWADAFSTGELANSAALTAALCVKHGIAARRATTADIAHALMGDRTITGICGHVDVNNAMRALGKTPESTHWDPGTSFPWDGYVADVASRVHPTGPVTVPGSPAPSPIPPEGHSTMIVHATVKAAGKAAGIYLVDNGHALALTDANYNHNPANRAVFDAMPQWVIDDTLQFAGFRKTYGL